MYKWHNWAIHHKFNIDQHEFETLFGLDEAAKFTLVVDLLVSLSLKQTRFLVFFISERVHMWVLDIGS